MSVQKSGPVTVAAPLVLSSIPIGDQAVLVTLDNTLGTSVTAWLEGSNDGFATKFDLAGYLMGDGSQATNGAAGFSVTDAAVKAWVVPCAGVDSVQLRLSALTGTANATLKSLRDFPRVTIPVNSLAVDTAVADGKNISTGTTTGTKIGTATSQKIGLWNATPIVQPANTVDYLAGLVNAGLRASGGTAAAAFPGLVSSSSPSAGIGYAAGSQGTAVSQATDRTTGVTCSGMCGQITTQATSLAAQTSVSFIVTNTSVALHDVVIASIQSGPTGGKTIVNVTVTTAGSFTLNLFNTDASVADTGAAVINFAIIKGSTATT